jgi:hypothetical protein
MRWKWMEIEEVATTVTVRFSAVHRPALSSIYVNRDVLLLSTSAKSMGCMVLKTPKKDIYGFCKGIIDYIRVNLTWTATSTRLRCL